MFNPAQNQYAYLGMNLPISSANINRTGFMLNERVKYATTQLALVTISTANPNCDGTGTVATLITGTSSGTLIKRIIIKAQGNTTQGMVRIFYYSGWLFKEIQVPATTYSSIANSFVAVIDQIFYLKAAHSLFVSTERAETFIVSAEGLDMSYPA